jgi:hypothetical protein
VNAHEITLVLPATHAPLHVSHVGIREHAMWPARRDALETGAAAGATARALGVLASVDAWVAMHTDEVVEPFAMACVGGVTVI